MYVTEEFHLPDHFIRELGHQPAPWGWEFFSEAIFYARYSHNDEETNFRQEKFIDVVRRVIEGDFGALKTAYHKLGRHWDDKEWMPLAKMMARNFYWLTWSPPGRGYWAGGRRIVAERGGDALQNCAFTEVHDLPMDAEWVMDMLMKGVGVGFDTFRIPNLKLHRPKDDYRWTCVVGDSREGWARSIRFLLDSYVQPNECIVDFDYSQVRPAGSPIKTFGGVASGPEPLRILHEELRQDCERFLAGQISSTQLITDIMNQIGKCVIAGNVRRSAEIAVGLPDDPEFMYLKDWEKYPDRSSWMHLSNNTLGVGYGSDDLDWLPEAMRLASRNGEPGLLNWSNVGIYGRFGEIRGDDIYRLRDDFATGINPCGEQPLEDKETCNLVVVYPTRCTTLDEFREAVICATWHGLAVSLIPSEIEVTNDVIARNHRIGVGLAGLADLHDSAGRAQTLRWCDYGYHIVRQIGVEWADKFQVNFPVGLTTVKPDGTTSLLAGVSPGMHWPWAPFVLRRVQQAVSSPVTERLIEAGIPHEPLKTDPIGTMVFEFPVRYGRGKTRSQRDVSAREQLEMLANYQRFWSDNAVSCTVTVRKEEVDGLADLVREYLPLIKSVSFLPADDGVYPQAPNETITEDEYNRRRAALKPIRWGGELGNGDLSGDLYCTGDTCEVRFETPQFVLSKLD